MRFTVDRLDHLVLTCHDIAQTSSWYQRVLGMDAEEFGEERRIALKFGGQKINLHQFGREFRPNAMAAAPGSQDLCFVIAVRPTDAIAHLHECGVTVEHGPSKKDGALGPMTSIYCRDPDGNLIELASYLPT